MRHRLRLLAAGAIVSASALGAAACGSGQDPTVEGDAAALTTTTAAVDATTATTTPDTAPGTSVTPGSTAPAGIGLSTTTAPPGTGEPVDDVPVAAFGPPAAGRYRFHTVGTSNGSPVDRQDDMVIEALSATDVRQSSPDGSQTVVLRYLADRVELLSLDAAMAGQTRHFDGPVLFAPIPPAGTWTWDLRSADGRTTAHQDGAFVGRETVTTPAGTFDAYRIDSTITVVEGGITATVQLQSWIDLGLRTAVRIHQTTTVPLLFQADATSDYLGFTPA